MTGLDKKNFMREALKLAKKGKGFVSPNPMVGCVIVAYNKIVGRGYHKKFGGKHAEINALHDAGVKAHNATMFVTLEPCCISGKTPPCTNTIIKSGVAKIIVAIKDPNPHISGRGIQLLKKQGISVEIGVEKIEASRLIKFFTTFITSGKPYIALKIAQSIDGKIADYRGKSKWITNSASRQLVQELRSEYDAVLVGINTVIKDNPRLTSRIPNGRDPFRLIADSNLHIPLSSKIITQNHDKKTIIITTKKVSNKKVSVLEKKGVRVWKVNSIGKSRVSMNSLASRAGSFGISSILVEGGQKIWSSLLDSGLAKKVYIFIAPALISGGLPAFNTRKKFTVQSKLTLKNTKTTFLAGDILMEGDL